MSFLQLIIFFFNYCRARCFSPLCHGILGTFQRWNLKVTSPAKSIFEFFPSVGKFLQLMFLGDNICMRASGLILPVMAMTVALNTNVSWFIWDCHCRYFFPGPGNRELHMAETFSTEPGKVRFLCEGRNSPFMRKWLRFFFLCVCQSCSFVTTLHMVLSFQKFSGVFRLHLNYWLVQILQYSTVWVDKDDRDPIESKWAFIFDKNRESIYTVKESKNWLM